MMDVTSQPWFTYLSSDQQELVITSFTLFDLAAQHQLPDYGYIVFPMAKAYEGFLKKYFFELGLITQQVYESRRFRIGRAFNPDVNMNQQDELWIFDDVAAACGSALAREMWEAWIECRNQVFHYFPAQARPISLAQAQAKLSQLAMVMDGAFRCQTQYRQERRTSTNSSNRVAVV